MKNDNTYKGIKKNRICLFVLLFFLVLNISSIIAQTDSVNVGGIYRKMIVYAPLDIPKNRPLLISMHGANQSADYQKNQAKYELIADTAKFVVVYPDAINKRWDISGDNDIDFILSIIEDMNKRYAIDRERVYLSGFSMGGMMTYHAANKIADKIAAFAPVGGYPMREIKTNSSRPVPIIHVHGTDDEVVRYDGVQKCMEAWVKRNNCEAVAKVSDPYPSNKIGSCATKNYWAKGDGGVEVALLTLKGKGHWHSNDSNCVNSSEEIWNFVKKYTLPSIEKTKFTNPIMWMDVPDMSATRVGDDFYLISTTMHLMPGAPVMKSKDLVNWEIASYVFDKLTDTPKYDLEGGTVYGRGQWASSIRYNNGKYYVLFSPNDQPFKSYIYSTTDPSGKWDLVSRNQHFHDASLFFDDDGRVYVFYGTASLKELKSDLSGVKENGVDMQIFDRDEEETGLLEGSQVVKHDGKYYLLMISWPKGKPRRQVCYRADKITGPYEKKVILEDNFAGFPYAGQGCLIDDKNGNWYGLIFQDREAVGRVPLLLPCRWVDGWPMLGDENGKVPLTGEVSLPTHDIGKRIVESDNFGSETLKINWQWNHNPINDSWSLTERPGYLRLKTNKIVNNLYTASNTITQRMEGAKCSGVVSLDVTKMKDGDVAGLSAFNGHSGILSITMTGGRKYLTMSTNVVDLEDRTKAIIAVKVDDKERIELQQNTIYLRVDADFNLHKDIATFYYSLDNKEWRKIGSDFKMVFDYRKLFMGTKFAIFNYATKMNGGYIDVDSFEYERLD